MNRAEITDTHPLAGLRDIAAAAARAGNSHNTQPWELRYHADHVEIGWRPEWALGPSDPSHRDLRLSQGTFIETMLISAAAAGIPVRFEPDYDAAATRSGRMVPADEVYPHGGLAPGIAKRRVWRGAWTEQQLPAATIAAVQQAAKEAGFRVAIVPTAEARPILVKAYHWFFGDAGIAAELMAWTRLSPKDPKYYEDGLNDVMLVLNKAERVAMKWLFSPVIYRTFRPLGLLKLLTALSSSATAGDGHVMVIMGRGKDPVTELEAGRLLARLWLNLLDEGIYAHPQSHVIDAPTTNEALAEVCGAEGDERPLVFFRAGYPAVDPAARPQHPRREVVVHSAD
jgi:nitroreductase